MEALILAGGLGTRLKSVVDNIPKPMATIADKPFLHYLFEYLYKQNIKKVILSVGYKYEIIQKYFGNRYKDIEIIYSIEFYQLGTGGAIKKALRLIEGKSFIIMNGDTYFNIDLNNLISKHRILNSELTLSLKCMTNFDRYGLVKTEGDKIIGFKGKQKIKKGNINGGIYVVNSNLLKKYNLPDKFSFESDFMEKYIDKIHANGITLDEYFIDIGIPDDYIKAQKELNLFI